MMELADNGTVKDGVGNVISVAQGTFGMTSNFGSEIYIKVKPDGSLAGPKDISKPINAWEYLNEKHELKPKAIEIMMERVENPKIKVDAEGKRLPDNSTAEGAKEIVIWEWADSEGALREEAKALLKERMKDPTIYLNAEGELTQPIKEINIWEWRGADGRLRPEAKAMLKDKVLHHFPPEFLARFSVEPIIFDTFRSEDITKIVDKQIKGINDLALIQSLDLKIQIDPEVKQYMYDNAYNPRGGMRDLKKFINKTLGQPISRADREERLVRGATLHFKMVDGKLTLELEAPPTSTAAR